MKYNYTKLNQDFLIARRSKEIETGTSISFSEIAKELRLSEATMLRARTTDTGSLITIAKMCRYMGKTIEEYLVFEDE